MNADSHSSIPLSEGPGNYGHGGGFGRGGKRGGFIRRDKEDKAHDSIIEERIQRERPCRTLFIRNIKASVIVIAREHVEHTSEMVPGLKHGLTDFHSMRQIVKMYVTYSKSMARFGHSLI